MLSLRRWLLGLAIASGLVQAAPQLTTIQDILYNADGTRFAGLVTISWQGFDAADTSDIASHVLRLPISSGFLQVQLVPTTNVNAQMLYSVTYTGDGGVQFSESWAVPPSAKPLRVRDVRVTAGSGSIVGGQQTTVAITDVMGLQNALNARPVMGAGYSSSRAAVIDSLGALDGAVGSSGDCLHVDGTAGPCGTGSAALFVDNESPAGTMDGINASFALANTPNPPSSLTFFRNGLLLRAGTDYSLAGKTIIFASGSLPTPGDILQVSYRQAGTMPGVGFVDGELPSGNINGANAVFSTDQTPSPTGSLALYRNGIRLEVNVDYTVAGKIITFGAGLAPQPGDVLQCFYRIAQ